MHNLTTSSAADERPDDGRNHGQATKTMRLRRQTRSYFAQRPTLQPRPASVPSFFGSFRADRVASGASAVPTVIDACEELGYVADAIIILRKTRGPPPAG